MRRPRNLLFGLGLAALGMLARAAEPLPVPKEVAPPPMYVAEPFAGHAFVGMPSSIDPEGDREWPRWFYGATGLVMTRTLPAGAATMQPLGGNQLLTSDAGFGWPGGVDLHIGRWFGPRQQHAVEMIYWGVYQMGSSATLAAGPPGIDAIPQAPTATVGGIPASDILTGAAQQRIERADVVNDVEINWVYSLWDRPEFLPRERAVNLMWLAGFRFFQVNDQLTLTTGSGDPAIGALDLGVATNNNIYGGQVGAKFDWRFLPRLRFNVVPKFMIGGNAITDTTSLAGSDGTQATFPGGAPARAFSELGVFSWLGSVDTGIAWDVTEHWSLWLGYRVVGVGNIAQADGQWPSSITSPASLGGITAGSETIIHGGFAGFQGRY
ncbi:MAG: BBP7 family outer membrane beta-barrel protein [Planctomycetota bacterium]